MVDFSNTKDRCILHVEGDVNDADYVELTTDDFEEDQAIAIFKFLIYAKIENLDLMDLQEEEFEIDEEYEMDEDEKDDIDEDDDDDEEDEMSDADISNELEKVMFDSFRESGLSFEEANDLLGEEWEFIPNCEDYLAHTIEDVKLYKFENKEFYYYDNGWKKVF